MKTKTVAQVIVVGIILALGLKIYSYVDNPVLLLRDIKRVKKHAEVRQRRVKYAFIKETRGSLYADLAECGDTWGDLGKDFKKMGRDFVQFFNF